MVDIRDQQSIEQVTRQILSTISGIKPTNLEEKTHAQNAREFVDNIVDSLCHCHKYQFVLLIEAIKEIKLPSYKRDFLIEALEPIVFSTALQLLKPDITTSRSKLFANAITSIPELVANCDSLNKYPQYQPCNFYSRLLTELEDILKHLNPDDLELNKHFYSQILIRISLFNQGQLVWHSITKKWIDGTYDGTRLSHILPKLLTTPLDANNSLQFDIFPSHLYTPVFQNAYHEASSGKKFKDLFGESILINDEFNYAICNRLLHQYKLDRKKQYATLFNSFSYLAAVSQQQIESEPENVTIIVKNFLEVIRSWSERHKIILRSLENSRFLTCAIVIAYRCIRELGVAIEQPLTKLFNEATSKEIQTRLMSGIHIHLDRASSDERNLAITLGELILPELNQLFIRTDCPELNFGVELDEDCQEIKKLLTEPYESSLFFNVGSSSEDDGSKSLRSSADLVPAVGSFSSFIKSQQITRKKVQFLPEEENDDIEDIEAAPMYLRDCITGLAESDKPDYIQLCLIKAGALISKLADEHKSRKAGNDAIRDIAIELASVLLTLDDQYKINHFDALRMQALINLTTAAPDMVAKYLLDQYNGAQLGIRHQLDVLHVLASSAQLQQEENDRPATIKFCQLCFYGIINRVKFDTNDSYLLSRIFLSVSLVLRCLDQQPIMFRLSSDLLDLIAAHETQPDLGVRKSMLACLIVIRQCCPRVHYEANLRDRLTRLWFTIRQ